MKKLFINILVAVALVACATSCKKYAERDVNTSSSRMTTGMCYNSFENIMHQEIDVY